MNTSLSLLEKQKDYLKTLNIILKDELRILKSRDRSLLSKNAEKKLITLNLIDETDKAIKSITLDTPLTEEEQLTFESQETEIKTLLGQCKHQNSVNGQIINSGQVAINRFKNMMQKSLKNQSSTYDSKGLTNINSTSLGLKA